MFGAQKARVVSVVLHAANTREGDEGIRTRHA